MKKYTIAKFLLLLVILGFISCSDDDNKPEEKKLIGYEILLNRSASELQLYLNASGLDVPIEQLKYNVDVYKINYKTQYKNESIVASGLVVLPKTTEAVGILSFQHGTIAAHAEAPTNAELNSGELVLYSALGSPGFIAVIPDFIGFGKSENLIHPYYVEDVTATSIIDNLKAAKELANEKGISFNGKLFLAGYSQGGYATMATHKHIEQNGLPGFNLIASFPSSGGYDVKHMQEYFFNLETYEEPFYLAYVAYAYKTTYDWSESLTDFFDQPYAERIPSLFSGEFSGSEINNQLTTNVHDFVNDNLIQGIDSDPKYAYIRDAFIENSLVDWTPNIPMYMYHGDTDITVPYENSVKTYERLIQNGASEDIVHLITLEGYNHSTGFYPYAEDFIPKLLSLK